MREDCPSFTAAWVAVALGQLGFRLIGEPLRGLMSEEEMERALGEAGFQVLSDEAPDAWERGVADKRARWLHVFERLAVAERADA